MLLISHQDNFPPIKLPPISPSFTPLLLQPFPLSQDCKAGEILHRLESLPRGQWSQPAKPLFSCHPSSTSPPSSSPNSSKTWRYEEEEEPPVSKSAGSLPSRAAARPSHRLQSAREGRRASSSKGWAAAGQTKPKRSYSKKAEEVTDSWVRGEQKE